VFPFNFFPALDVSVFETLDQFEAVIKRNFEEKARTEVDIVARVDTGSYRSSYELLRDVATNLFWAHRYAMTMYDKRRFAIRNSSTFIRGGKMKRRSSITPACRIRCDSSNAWSS